MKLKWSKIMQRDISEGYEYIEAEGNKGKYVCGRTPQDDDDDDGPWLACVVEREGMDSKRPLCEAVLEIAKMICQEHEDRGWPKREEDH